MASKPQTKIVVTGGAGFIGTHLCSELRRQGHEVSVLDLRAPQTPIPGVHYEQGDVRDTSLVLRLLDGASAAYHLAATVSVPLCQLDPVESQSNNVGGTISVLEAIRKQADAFRQPPIRLAFASTAALYGSAGDDGRALREQDGMAPFLSFYAAQKHACEQVLDQYRKAFGIPSIPFRFFNVFGPGQDPTSPYSGVITIFCALARDGKPMRLNGGGIQTRDFVAVQDIAGALAKALDLPADRWDARAVNLGSGRKLTIRALAEAIRAAAGTGSPIEDAPPREGDVVHSLADISRARELLGYSPSRELTAAISELLRQ